MIEGFFFGGSTPEGFSTQIAEHIGGREYYTYILKGGPGTGKSRMMKKIAERFGETEDVTRFYCPADPDSLDAVMLHESKVIVVDGTPPHVFEPRFPGVCQEIVDLGRCWDKAVLRENREEIIEAGELNRSIMAAAADYCRALGQICDDTRARAEGFADRQRIEEAAKRFCGDLVKDREGRAGRGKGIIRQMSAMTRYGYMTLPEAIGSCHRICILEDDRFAASGMFIDLAAEQMMECGYDVKLSTCLLSERRFSEHLLIDEIGAALMTSGPLAKIGNENAERMDCSPYYDEERMRPYEKCFAADRSLMGRIAGASRRMLEDAKRVHDEIEGYYISAMDLDALDRVCERICEEIERRGTLTQADA